MTDQHGLTLAESFCNAPVSVVQMASVAVSCRTAQDSTEDVLADAREIVAASHDMGIQVRYLRVLLRSDLVCIDEIDVCRSRLAFTMPLRTAMGTPQIRTSCMTWYVTVTVSFSHLHAVRIPALFAGGIGLEQHLAASRIHLTNPKVFERRLTDLSHGCRSWVWPILAPTS